jgi:uncharacterized membrane protein
MEINKVYFIKEALMRIVILLVISFGGIFIVEIKPSYLGLIIGIVFLIIGGFLIDLSLDGRLKMFYTKKEVGYPA